MSGGCQKIEAYYIYQLVQVSLPTNIDIKTFTPHCYANSGTSYCISHTVTPEPGWHEQVPLCKKAMGSYREESVLDTTRYKT